MADPKQSGSDPKQNDPADPVELAKSVVAEHLRPLAKKVERKKAGALAGGAAGPSADDAFVAELEKRGHKVEDAPDSAEVEFPESTPVGSRSTVVQVRRGKVAKKLKLGKL